MKSKQGGSICQAEFQDGERRRSDLNYNETSACYYFGWLCRYVVVIKEEREILRGTLDGEKLLFNGPEKYGCEHDPGLDSRDYYVGQRLDELEVPHGVGKIFYVSGAVYEGLVDMGQRSGKGNLTFPNGSSYNGTWTDDVMTDGTFSFARDDPAERDFYIGDLSEGHLQPEGHGVLAWKDGSVYDGQFEGGYMWGDGTLTYSNGSKLEGNWLMNRQNGLGRLTFAQNDPFGRDFYNGEFRDNEINGLGKLVWKNGDVYEGRFELGIRSGNGTILFENGAKFEGLWQNDSMTTGKLTYAGSQNREDYFIGDFVDGKIKKGRLVYKDGSSFEGIFGPKGSSDGIVFEADGEIFLKSDYKNILSGRWHLIDENGFGKFIYGKYPIYHKQYYLGPSVGRVPEGEGKQFVRTGIYEGHFWRGLRSGPGTATFSNGASFEGHWLDDLIVRGNYTFPKDNKDSRLFYSGQFSDDRFGVNNFNPFLVANKQTGKFSNMHGTGKLGWTDGSVFEGSFRNGEPVGFGTMKYPDGSEYLGQWNGLPSGQGTLTYGSNDQFGRKVFRGNFDAGKPNGVGMLTWKDGAHYNGQFVNGDRHGNGTFVFPDGVKYVGKWDRDQRHGSGTLTDKDGFEIYQGQWENDEQKPDSESSPTLPGQEVVEEMNE